MADWSVGTASSCGFPFERVNLISCRYDARQVSIVEGKAGAFHDSWCVSQYPAPGISFWNNEDKSPVHYSNFRLLENYFISQFLSLTTNFFPYFCLFVFFQFLHSLLLFFCSIFTLVIFCVQMLIPPNRTRNRSLRTFHRSTTCFQTHRPYTHSTIR